MKKELQPTASTTQTSCSFHHTDRVAKLFITFNPQSSEDERKKQNQTLWCLHRQASRETLNRTRNLEATGCEDKALALAAETHTLRHLEEATAVTPGP